MVDTNTWNNYIKEKGLHSVLLKLWPIWPPSQVSRNKYKIRVLRDEEAFSLKLRTPKLCPLGVSALVLGVGVGVWSSGHQAQHYIAPGQMYFLLPEIHIYSPNFFFFDLYHLTSFLGRVVILSLHYTLNPSLTVIS